MSDAVAIDLDAALVDTRPLWRAWLADAGPLLGVEPRELPDSRAEAAATLDALSGNWRALLARYAEERIAVHVRREPAVGEALRALAGAGRTLGVFTDAPEPLARLALVQIGASRRISALETGLDAVERLRARLGGDPLVVRSRAELVALASQRT